MNPGVFSHQGRQILLFLAALTLGLAIAWVDARPRWDDAGITAIFLLLSGGLLGLIEPRLPWLWALCIGVWIPLHMVLHNPSLGSVVGGCAILAIPVLGAYAGKVIRHIVQAA